MTLLIAAALAIQQPLGADPSAATHRLGLYLNLFSQYWLNDTRFHPPTGRMIEGLVDYGECWIDYDPKRVRIRSMNGFRKGGWMSASTQPPPPILRFRAVQGTLERQGFKSPTSVFWETVSFSRTTDFPFPYYAIGYEIFKSRHVVAGKGDEQELRLTHDQFRSVPAGTIRYEFVPPPWTPEGWPKEHRSGKFQVFQVQNTRTEHRSAVPESEKVYISEFEPFLFEESFPKRLLKAVREGETLEFWVLARTKKFVRIRAFYRGKQRLAFREIDQPALRFDLAGFKTNDKGTWTRLASVWVDEKDGKFLLGDDSDGFANGLFNPFALFRLEPERPSDVNFVYPPFVRSERFEK